MSRFARVLVAVSLVAGVGLLMLPAEAKVPARPAGGSKSGNFGPGGDKVARQPSGGNRSGASAGRAANVSQNRTTNVKQTTKVNRDTRNTNVNVNKRDVNVNVNSSGGYYGRPVYVDPTPNTGAVVAAAAVGVAVGAAVASQPTVVVAPAYGTRVYALPGGCVNTVVAGVAYHNCNSVYYRPYYQGTTVVYEVVRI